MRDSLSSAFACVPDLVQGRDEGIPRDQALLDLFGENVRIALRDGGLVAQWQLGQAIARYLTERQREAET